MSIDTPNDVLGVDSELASAFGNLVSNAIRYTPPGGTVTLAWREGLDGARFSVEDTGIGIEPEHIPRLTERFYRVDRSRSRETGGTGLGLAIAKHALARHDATPRDRERAGQGEPLQRALARRWPRREDELGRMQPPRRATSLPGCRSDLNARLGALTLGVDDDPAAELRVQHVLANAEAANVPYR